MNDWDLLNKNISNAQVYMRHIGLPPKKQQTNKQTKTPKQNKAKPPKKQQKT